MTDDIKLPEPSGYFYEWESAVLGVHRSCSNCTHNELSPHKSIPLFTADQLRAAVRADRAERVSDAEQVCYEAYQVVGSMLEDLGQFGSGRSWKVLDNLNQAKKVHDDVLPWPSFKADGRKPLTSDQCDDIFDRVACEGPDGFECDWMDVIRATERAHDIVEKESGNE